MLHCDEAGFPSVELTHATPDTGTERFHQFALLFDQWGLDLV